VLAVAGQFPVTDAEFLRDRLEDRASGDIPGIHFVKERHMEVCADQHSQANLTEIVAFLFVVATLWEGCWRTRVDEGEEMGAVIGKGAE
jgi:hypothetical protein